MSRHLQRTATTAAAMISMTFTSYVSASPFASRSSSAESRDRLIVALSPEQAQACRRERQSLQQQLSQCGSNDQCRRNVQAAIDAHNARCR